MSLAGRSWVETTPLPADALHPTPERHDWVTIGVDGAIIVVLAAAGAKGIGSAPFRFVRDLF
jgi:hypothetical protein